jgi:3-dehydroquinate synthase
MKTLTVGLAERSYPIIIKEGLLAEVGRDLKDRKIAKRYVIISDSHVAALYGEALLNSLKTVGLAVDLVTFPRGESSKHLATVADLAGKLARLGVDRKDGLIALGGGVTGDITGFLAATYMRGISFVQVPTTLLAQVDSSVGGKTGVDIPEGKNLVGAFYQPKAVYIDSLVLKTLPAEEFLNGLAEVIKYGIIYDADFFHLLAAKRQEILARALPVLEEVVSRCCAIKAEVVAKDERESNLRRILNFGHTLGHAVEAASNFELAHGLAVAIGMVAASRLAQAKKLLSGEDMAEISSIISQYGLPTEIPAGLDRGKIKFYLTTDKKAVSGRPFYVLPTGIGKVTITDEVDEALVDKLL